MTFGAWLAGGSFDRHCGVQLLATVLLLLAMPWAEPHSYGRVIVSVLFLIAIASGIRGMPHRYRRRAIWLVGVLGTAWLVTRTAGMVLPVGPGAGLHVYQLVGFGLTFLVLANIVNILANSERISFGVLETAFTGYLIVAITFGELYAILNELLGGAFNVIVSVNNSVVVFTYFSLVTLATIGFGDIVPVHPFVRVVAALEGVCGMFYTAVVISRLVLAYRPHRKPPSEAHQSDEPRPPKTR